jgi:DNA-binding transcriptional regulator/RsmH inhibitor MraZ
VVKPDSAGRIVLPMELLKKLDIAKDVYLVGRIQMFEIWNPDVYEKISQNEDIEAEKIITEKQIKL